MMIATTITTTGEGSACNTIKPCASEGTAIDWGGEIDSETDLLWIEAEQFL